jgi:hypothetical protein
MEGERKPWLMYLSGKNLTDQTFCSISDPTKFYSANIPQRTLRLNLRTVEHDWYLWEDTISNYVSSLFLWNPLNLKKIMLPNLNHNGTEFRSCILSCPPTTNDETCSIFLFSSHCPSIFYYQLGDKQWTKRCFYTDIVSDLAMKGRAPMEENKTIFDEPVYYNGCFYAGMWISGGFIIVVIENLQSYGFSINCTLDPMVKTTFSMVSFGVNIISNLIASNNVLFRIDILHDLDRVIGAYVYKFDCSQRVWGKVENIQDKVFFVSSRDSAFACQTVNPEIDGGRIYIALKNLNYFYIYNNEDNSLVTSPPILHLSKSLSYSRWFVPDIRYFTFFE